MTWRGKVGVVSGALAVLIASCTAASHLSVLQPPTVPPSPPLAIPSPSPSPPASPAPAPVQGAPRMQFGIDIDAYTYPGQNIPAAAAADMAYITSLHANSVMISFPFFAAGPSTVTARKSTPTPAALGEIVTAAQRAHLFVLIRPLLDESSLGKSRVVWRPPNMQAWFASYRKFLLPYAAMAQRLHVPEFAVGAELSQFEWAPRWNGLDRALARVYHGRLVYALNWTTAKRGVHGGGRAVTDTVDAYAPQTGNLTQGWEAYDRLLPPGTVETEVSIDAIRGAYRAPAKWHWNASVIDQSVQVRWFTAACKAAQVTHLGGIYFWSIVLSTSPARYPTIGAQGAWSGGRGATAIRACFTGGAK